MKFRTKIISKELSMLYLIVDESYKDTFEIKQVFSNVAQTYHPDDVKVVIVEKGFDYLAPLHTRSVLYDSCGFYYQAECPCCGNTLDFYNIRAWLNHLESYDVIKIKYKSTKDVI